MHIVIQGAVQGMGFRPFVYRLASSLGLSGWVTNSSHGVVIEAEGNSSVLKAFLLRLESERPPLASIASLEYSLLDALGLKSFTIEPSTGEESPTAVVLPDIATCYDCRRELLDRDDRRYHYPFVNCTNCGPRYSIIQSLPYDRPGTTMRAFTMCPECSAEYHDPASRRFHAQPNACPVCGPWLELWDETGAKICAREEALQTALAMLRSGKILAVKGVGGFHLMCSALEEQVVRELRLRKRRAEKPLALMVGDLVSLSRLCEVDPLEERLLCSPESPIVLLRRLPDTTIAPSVAPGNPTLGVMLPSTPLHLLMLQAYGQPLVATSGNLSDEPICIDEHEAITRLRGIADAFLVHNRPILRQIDDSVVRIVLGRELVLRRARGYAPLPVEIPQAVPDLLAVGAQLKSAVAVARGRRVFLSQHLGDLESAESRQAFERESRSLQELYRVSPERVVCDLHPDYLSTIHARASGFPVVAVQHHYAHIASCMAENGLDSPVLGVSWDGTGFGTDGTIWGGEFLSTDATGFTRVARLRRFRLPGGEQAVREPRRSALALLYEVLGAALTGMRELPPVASFSERECDVLVRMIERGVNAPLTSSAGRLFDAVSALLGIRQVSTFEGQGAMELEWASAGHPADPGYAFELRAGDDCLEADWEGLSARCLRTVHSRPEPWRQSSTARLPTSSSRSAQHTATPTSSSAAAVSRTSSPWCAVGRLQGRVCPYWHQRVPPNDGGIALGQIYAAARAGLA